ncbi:hypothetical protein N9H38_02535 [Candidatus Pelagibacter sp.]|nr:hypothetical protein [Candidatus Pelagibacter sp.]
MENIDFNLILNVARKLQIERHQALLYQQEILKEIKQKIKKN